MFIVFIINIFTKKLSGTKCPCTLLESRDGLFKFPIQMKDFKNLSASLIRSEESWLNYKSTKHLLIKAYIPPDAANGL